MRVVDPTQADDADLVAVLTTDPAAVEEFYRRHVRPLTRFARRRLGDEDAAGDLVAATFLAAIESSPRYEPGRGAASAWLHGIAANLIASQRRRRAVELRALSRLSGQRVPPPDEFGRVEEQMDAGTRTRPVLAGLRALPTAERELVDLLVNDDVTVSEAAHLLGIRPATARMRLSRARGRLGIHLGDTP